VKTLENNATDAFNAVRNDSLSEQVFAQLTRTILCGGFAPNDRINLRNIARDYEVSVTPVREAVLRLVSDGILQTTERNAIIVPQRFEEDIREIFRIRRTLEGELAEAACLKLTPTDVAALNETQANLVAALEKENYREALRLNADLHFRIYSAAQMPIYLKIVESLWLRIGPTLRNMYPILNQRRTDHSPHELILASATAADATGLREAIIADLTRSEQALTEYLRRVNEAQALIAMPHRGYR